jgi:hypothetical protein
LLARGGLKVSQLQSQVLYACDEAAAVEALHAARRTDGLPVIAPTPARVEQMLLHSPGLDPDVVLGEVAPMGGELTVEAAAVNAVMAGCLPETFPLVIAACEAIVDPIFELGPLQNTTHCIAPLIIVNGPAAKDFGFASGVGAMGPGHRANLTLGRAIRLVMMNVGGGYPGVGDMATIGSPAKISCCIAEDEGESPFADTLHTSRGFAPDESTVTVLGVEGPHSLIYNFAAGEGPDGFLRMLAAGFAAPTSNNIYLGKGTVAAALNPVHARLIRDAGLTRRQAQQRIFDFTETTWGAVRRLGGVNVAPHLPDDGVTHAVARPEDILLFSSGEEGAIYSAFFPSWGGGQHGNQAVTKRVRTADFCETPPSLR